MADIRWSKGKFVDVVERHIAQKKLLIINLTFSLGNATEDTMIQDTLLASVDFSNVRYVAAKVNVDIPDAKVKLIKEKYLDIEGPGILIVGFDDAGNEKVYDLIPSLSNMGEKFAPILAEYSSYYAKFRDANPDFHSEDEEPEVKKTEAEIKAELAERIRNNRKIKAEQERLEAHQREIKRIEDGKKALDMQEKIKEVQMKRDIETNRREREAAARHLAELRERERLDRLERELERKHREELAAGVKNTEKPNFTAPVVNSDECRICYQFPDGARVMKIYKSSVSFQEVYDGIKDDHHIDGNYKLFQTFPRRAIEEYGKNLVELGLTPASVLAVMKNTSEPESNQVVPRSVNFIRNTIMTIYSMAAGLLTSFTCYIGLLFGIGVVNPNSPPANSNDQESSRNGSRQGQRGGEGRTTTRDGRIGRLGDEDSDNSDANWNGNSTQQL